MDDQGYQALQWAALNNRVACCSFLLERGAPVNATDTSGQNALHWAAVRGSLSAAETLLRAGADLAAQDCRGYTARDEDVHCSVAIDCGTQLICTSVAPCLVKTDSSRFCCKVVKLKCLLGRCVTWRRSMGRRRSCTT